MATSSADMLTQGWQCLRSGDAARAEQIARPILLADQGNINALLLLRNALQQLGKVAQCIELYRQTLKIHPTRPDLHYDLGIILALQGQLDEAVAALQRVLELKPYDADVHNNLGNILGLQGKLAQAIPHFQAALQIKPAFVDALHKLGLAQLNLGNADADAILSFQRALKLKPDFPEACRDLGIAFEKTGRNNEAIAAYREALRLRPDFPFVHNRLGNALMSRGRPDEAIAAYQQATRLKPDFAEAHNNLCVAFVKTQRLDDALASAHEALRLKPDYVTAHINLGNALRSKGQPDDAIAAYHRAIDLKPDYPDAHFNLGIALCDQDLLDDAIAAYRRAIDLEPNYPEALNNLSNALKDQGLLDESLAASRRAIACKPDYSEAHSNLVFNTSYHPAFDAPAIALEARRWNQHHADPLKKFILPHFNDRHPHRRLRIGYVSPDLREHPVGRFLLPLLAHHDKSQVEVFAYAHVPVPDDLTQKLRSHTDAWHNIVALSDSQAADLVRSDHIDILVDLALHTARHRLLLFARKPAPVQVTWLGYPGTTGMPTIDYRLSDPHLDPPGLFDTLCPEQTLRLPHSFWCYDPLDCRELPLNPLPAQAHNHLTLGCLNNFCKINDQVLLLWAQILRALPSARLLLWASDGTPRQRTLNLFNHEGVDPQRIEFLPRQPRRQYMESYHRIDLGLDTFPYNGHTTSLDAFWMGVPIITLVGQTVVGRAGLCQLMNLGLPELIAHTPDQYVQLAINLAHDLSRLAGLRSTLRDRMLQSPLMDAPLFARNIEAAYRQIWHTWCSANA